MPAPARPPPSTARTRCSRPRSGRSGARAVPAPGPDSSSRMLLRSGESGPPCGVPSVRGDTSPPVHHPRLQIAANQEEHSFVLHPARHACHQHVVVHAVEEFLEVHVHHPSMSRRDVLAGAPHRLVRAPSRTKAEARVRERRVEDRLRGPAAGLVESIGPAPWGCPASASLPSGLGISTRRTGCGTYVPLSSSSRIRAQCSRQYGIRSSTVIPSTPGAPPLRTTRACAASKVLSPQHLLR